MPTCITQNRHKTKRVKIFASPAYFIRLFHPLISSAYFIHYSRLLVRRAAKLAARHGTARHGTAQIMPR
jgi:hypothetical protein